MNLKLLKVLITLLMLFFIIQSCDDDGDETLISTFESNESHQTGMNCMSCHTSGGDGEGWFTLAGTVYDSASGTPYPNAIIKLYSDASGSGTPVKTIEVDKKGNFYTTENIDFKDGLYVSATGESEILMNAPVTEGACNRCHGVSAEPIWVE